MTSKVKHRNGETVSLQGFIEQLFWAKSTAERNHIDISRIPVVIQQNYHRYPVNNVGCSFGKEGMVVSLEYFDCEELKIIPKDKRPNEKFAEFWKTRGVSDGFDVAGFVESKEAGERLDRMVKVVLEKNETKSWLDWRESEPEWIQYKFNGDEFDVEKLSNMTVRADGVVTMDMLIACKK